MNVLPSPLIPVRAELVEALFFFGTFGAKEGQPFDKLRANGLRISSGTQWELRR